MNLASIIATHATSRPQHPAVEYLGQTIDYRTLWQRIESFSAVLAAAGVKPGDRVGLALGEHPEHLILHYALPRLGAVLLPLDHRWTVSEKQAVSHAFGAKLVVIDEAADDIPNMRYLRLDTTWSEHTGALPPWPSSPDLPLLISLSSGTTGRPTGAVVTHQQMYERFVNQWVTLSFTITDRFVSVTPMYFGGARSFTMSFLAAGATVILDPLPHTPDELVTLIRCSNASVTFMVPTILRRLLPLADPNGERLLPNLRRLLVSGAVIYAEEAKAVCSQISEGLIGYYASSEGGGISVLQPPDVTAHAETVGQPAFRVELEIVDPQDQPVAEGEAGRLRYRGPGVATSFLDADGRHDVGHVDGWFYPGDLASIGPQGHVTLRGREKDMIIRGGVNIYPAEVERTLMEHEAVREAAVVSWPSPGFGEEVAAFVTLDHDVNPDLLIAFCREQLAPYKVPRAIFIKDILPKRRSDKIDKMALQQLLPALDQN